MDTIDHKVPDSNGHFGEHGGRFVPETLMVALEAPESVNVATSSFSGKVSASTGTVKVALVEPAEMVSVPLEAV